MCIEDIRLGRKTSASQLEAPLTGTSALVVGNALNRIALIFSPPSASVATLSLNRPSVDGEGLIIAAGDRPIKLNIRDHGRLVTSQWFGIVAAGAETISVFETFLEEQ